MLCRRSGARCAGQWLSAAAVQLADVPAEDPRVYEMICRADTVGRVPDRVARADVDAAAAEAALLLRSRDRGGHRAAGPDPGRHGAPYLRRREGKEPVTYPSPEVAAVLERTLGVPIFQEQVMQLAVVAAGFTPGEADQLRRAMAAWKRTRRPRAVRAATRRRACSSAATPRSSPSAIFRQILGFGEYGFPESHSASFALLVYVSCLAEASRAGRLLRGAHQQPAHGLLRTGAARARCAHHGVEVRPASVCASDYDCTLEPRADGAARAAVGALSGEVACRESRRSGSWQPARQTACTAVCRN